jgi:hypothetical protein
MKIRLRVKCMERWGMTFILAKLVKRFCWFEVEPLPDNEWFITVKEEQEAFCRKEFAKELLEVFAYDGKKWFFGSVFSVKGSDGCNLVQVSRYPENLLFKVGTTVMGLSHQDGCNLAHMISRLRYNSYLNFKDLWVKDHGGSIGFKIGIDPVDTGINYAALSYYDKDRLVAALLGKTSEAA